MQVNPELIKWAFERSRIDEIEQNQRFPQAQKWARGENQPTLIQLENFAADTRTPLGYFFLPAPPVERLPIQDFRNIGSAPLRPSPDLLDTIYTMQRRQDWLREDRLEVEADELDFVGAARLGDEPDAVGREMRRALRLDDGWTSVVKTWRNALDELRRRIDDLGVMTVINGIVGNNTSRKLNVQEFRGFALVDFYAPAIFVNGSDAKSAQMFTLAHELAHVWLGRGGEGVSGFDGIFPGNQSVERFCDQAAAEFLVPGDELSRLWLNFKNNADVFERIARHFKVSPIVAGRRALDLQFVSRDEFFDFYNEYTHRELEKLEKTTGGDFYKLQNNRIGSNFAISVMRAALDGRLSFKSAYELTDLRGGTFQEYGRRLGLKLT